MRQRVTSLLKSLICAFALCIIQTDAHSQFVPREANNQIQTPVDHSRIEPLREQIYKEIAELNSRPAMVTISPGTKNPELAKYYIDVASQIEAVGTSHFPEKHGKKLYGSLMVAVPIGQDGKIYETGGGPRVEGSSGNADLDVAALLIVRLAAPFPPFNAKMPASERGQFRLLIFRFVFSHDENSDALIGEDQVKADSQAGEPVGIPVR